MKRVFFALGLGLFIGAIHQTTDTLADSNPKDNAGQSDECCDEPGQVTECWFEDGINDGITCSEDSECASGVCDLTLERCTCDDHGDCADGRCNSSGRCGPSWCNGFMVCSCWGGCTWWSEQADWTPNDEAAAQGMYCCESFYAEEPVEDMPVIEGYYSLTPCLDGDCQSDADCNDSNPCTDDTCDLGSGTCEYAFNTGPCADDGLFCNGAEVCDGAGNCDHAGDPCDPTAQCNDTCNEAFDNCFSPAGTACSDGNPCTDPDTCDGAGNCAGGAMLDCDDANVCTTDVCQDDGSGNAECVYSDADGQACDADGDPCTVDDTCAGGSCAPGALYDCSALSTQCTNGVCQDDGAGNPTCVEQHLAAGTACDDAVFCNGADTCDGNGVCVGTGDPCAGGGICNDICNETADNCFSPSGTACDADSSACTPDDTCDGAGACVADTGNAVDCTSLADQCNNLVCDAATGNCDYDNAALIGAQCNLDDNGCTLETCQGPGADQQLTCTALSTSVCDDGNVCTDDDCTSTGVNSYTCDNPPLPDTTGCNADSNGCTEDDHCDGAGGCAPGTAVTPGACATQLGVDTDCNTGLCVSTGDNSYTCTADILVTSPGDCNADNDGCTLDTCQNSGDPLVGAVCTVGSAYDCSALDNPPCQYGYCDDFGDFYNYSCQSGDAADTVACNFDSNGCTVDDHCDGAGSCTAGDPAVCTPSDACQNAVCQSTGDNTFTCPETPIANCCVDVTDCAALVCPGSADPPVGCSQAACVGNSCICQNEAVGTACTDYSQVDFPQNCYDGLCDAAGVCVPTQHPAYNNMCSDAFQAGDPTQIDTTGDWYMGAIPNTAPSGTTLSITGSTTCAYNNYAAAGDNCIEDASSTDLGEDGRDLVYVFEYQANAVDEYDLYAYVIKLEANYDIGVYVKTDIVNATDCPEGNDPTADDPDAGGFQGSVLSNTCVFPYNDGSTPNPPPAVIEDECEGDVNLLFDQECCDPCTEGYTCGYWWCERGYPDGCDMCTPGDCDGIWRYPEPAVECSSTVSGPGWDDYDYLASAIISAQGAGDSSWKKVFIFVDGVAAEAGDFKVTVEKREWSAGPCDRVDDDTRIFDVTHPEPGGSVYMGTFENTVNSMHAGGGSCGGYNCNGAFSGRTGCHGSGSANPFWPNDVNFKINRSAAEGDGTYCIITNESIPGGADLVVDMIRRWDSNAITICDESYSGMWCERNNFGNSIKEEFTAGAGELYLLSISEYGYRDAPCDPTAGEDCYFELTVYEGACPPVCLPPNDTVMGTVNVNDPSWNQVIFTDRITTSDGDDYWLKSGDDEDHVYELYNNSGQTIEVTFEVCGDYDAVLGLLDCEQTRLESEDDVGDGGCEQFDYDVPASTDPYYIIVDTDGNPALDDYTLTVSWGTPPSSCVDWSTWYGGPALTGTVTIDGTGFSLNPISGNTTDSADYYDPTSNARWNGRDELWEVVVTADSRVRFSGCNNGGSGSYDGMARLFDCEGTRVASNNNGCGSGGMPRFTVDLEAALSPYYLLIDGVGNNGYGAYAMGLDYR